ncbi:1927_t:CDS:1, partial [Cetraspora pellucida]
MKLVDINQKSFTKEQTTSHISYYYPGANLKISESKKDNNEV